MLRITVLEEREQVMLKLEGSLVGIWVKETESAWRTAQSALKSRPLVLDLKGVDRVDHAGVYLLALLYLEGVLLVASGAAMTELVRSIETDWSRKRGMLH